MYLYSKEQHMKNMKVLYIAGIALITLFGAYYYQDILLKRNITNQVKEKPVITSENSIKRKFNVKGMFCTSCKDKIETSVLKINGVLQVNVDQKTNEMVVTYNKANENVKETLTVVKDLGYVAGLKSQGGKLQVLDFNVTFQ
jgi:copper chaperone CopZ